MKKLSTSDYRKILKFYNIKSKRLTKKQIKKRAETVLAKKLCSCIKKVNKTKKISIAICMESVIKRKKLKIKKFTCRKKPKFKNNNSTYKIFKI